MITKVQKWGNSLGVRIPKSFAAEADFSSGTEIDMSIEKGVLMLKPIPKPKYDIETLVAAINDANQHDYIDSDSPVGNEVW